MSAEIHYQNGIKALQGGNFPEAEKEFQTATVLNPNKYESWNLLGLTYQFQKKWNQCIDVWKQALRCQPDSTDTLLNLGVACIAAERPKVAEQYWNRILEIDPDNVRCLINLGLFYREREVNQKAHDMWARACTLMPENAKVQEWLADVKGLLGMQKIIHQQFDEAEELLIDAVSLDPEYAVLWGYLSELHFQKQEYKKAFATCSKGLNIEPENSTLHHTMGNILRMTHQEDQALIAYQKALDYGSKHPATYRAIAELSENTVDENEQVIELLFDQYAESFDSDLIENLKYATPTKAHELYSSQNTSEIIRSILDLGCGTGLSILPFRSHCSTDANCVGVDLSGKMLDIAKKKKIYTNLHCESIKDYLEHETTVYDLVLCLDTLVYIRHIDTICKRVFELTKRTFIFSTEDTQATEPTLQRSGRYAHPPNYVENALKEAGFNDIKQQKSLLRKDGDHWIEGIIWMAQK